MALYRHRVVTVDADDTGVGSAQISLGDFGGAVKVLDVWCLWSGEIPTGPATADAFIKDEQSGQEVQIATNADQDDDGPRVAVNLEMGSRATIRVAAAHDASHAGHVGGDVLTAVLTATVYLEVG